MFRSKAQARKIASLTAKGEFPKEKFVEWANSTNEYERLPERVEERLSVRPKQN